MLRKLIAFAVLLAGSFAYAAVEDTGTHVRYYGTGANDNDVLFTTGDVSRQDACMLMSTTGSVDVYVSLDGTNYSTTAMSLMDFGATDTVPVQATVALRVYGFPAKFRRIRVLQVGATAAAASLNCWKYGT